MRNWNISGRIKFDPPDYTKKHIKQSEWKRVVIIEIDSELDAMYRWYLSKNLLNLNKPIRDCHVTVVNDRYNDTGRWNSVKQMYDGQTVNVNIRNWIRSNGEHWWLKMFPDENLVFGQIRSELGLGQPYFNYHMTIGLANERNIDHSKYLHRIWSGTQ